MVLVSGLSGMQRDWMVLDGFVFFLGLGLIARLAVHIL